MATLLEATRSTGKTGNIALSGRASMYAIVFDMDTAALKENYPTESFENAYTEIRNVLEKLGFQWMQGSTYFGGDKIDAVRCVMAIIEVTRQCEWFAESVRDVRMLRIEENNDLMPAVRNAGRPQDLYD
jgi:virulence-associated protein VapD